MYQHRSSFVCLHSYNDTSYDCIANGFRGCDSPPLNTHAHPICITALLQPLTNHFAPLPVKCDAVGQDVLPALITQSLVVPSRLDLRHRFYARFVQSPECRRALDLNDGSQFAFEQHSHARGLCANDQA